MFQELSLAVGYNCACILYGIDPNLINNLTIKINNEQINKM